MRVPSHNDPPPPIRQKEEAPVGDRPGLLGTAPYGGDESNAAPNQKILFWLAAQTSGSVGCSKTRSPSQQRDRGFSKPDFNGQHCSFNKAGEPSEPAL